VELPVSTQLGFGITCIDANYIRPGLACFYLLEHAGECAIIETGTSRSLGNLQQEMTRRGLAPEQVRYVIPTHVHLDHAGGAGAMLQVFPDAQLLIHPRGARHMADPQRLVASSEGVYGKAKFRELYGEITPVDALRIRVVRDGESIDLAGRPLQVRHTRGHAEHHFCVWDECSRGWFSGDMFGISYPWFRFAGGDFILPATTPTQFDPQAYSASLEILRSYDPQRIYLTHSGELLYTNEKVDLLQRQITAYAEMAADYADDLPSLKQALANYSLSMMREFDSQNSDETLLQLLAFDLDLNAQGLAVWQQR
jgi:glyoxylase-like metal-dependent hydrolase (beta-lactamase superfamily II)